MLFGTVHKPTLGATLAVVLVLLFAYHLTLGRKGNR